MRSSPSSEALGPQPCCALDSAVRGVSLGICFAIAVIVSALPSPSRHDGALAASRAEMAPYLSRALCALALVAHASALALRTPLRAPLALGRRTALLRMALPASVMEFVPESVASDAAQMQQVEETWKVSASSQASRHRDGLVT